LPGWLWLADLEPGDRAGGGAGDLGEQEVAVVDAPGAVCFFDVEGSAGVADPDVDALAGDDQAAAAVDPALDADRVGRRLGCRAGGSGVTQPGLFGRSERVGQAAQQGALVDQLQQAAVEANSDPPAGEMVADGVLSADQPDHADGADQPVHLDRAARRDGWALVVRRVGPPRPAAG
jgi:hypothetical protein